jgi:RES domain-containing protein
LGVIEVFRLGPASFKDGFWNGEGGLHVDGRWHTAGHRIIYCAQSLSLAQLEVLVHIADRRQLPELLCGQARIPTSLSIPTVDEATLPAGWRRFSPYSFETQRIGFEWLTSASSVALKVPSAVSPSEWNYLLNPVHADFQKLELTEPRPFAMDPRIP